MISLNVNGEIHQVDVDPEMPLLWVLRDVLGLTGTKYGCGRELCGACTVLVDGQREYSCVYEVKEASGRAVTTIEGLSPNRSNPIQKAWIKKQVPQCGYCQSGMIMAAEAKRREGAPGREIVNEVQNLCVCGTYQRIRKALGTLK
jgi:isoquinoline 1-oxidoreductase alpha subunit